MIKKIACYMALLLFSWSAIYYFSISYSFSDFKDFTAILLSASGMVFTIMGIWIAFLYPNALSRIVNPEIVLTVDFSESLQETKRLEAIVGSVLKSASVIFSLMIIFLVKVIFFNSNLYLENIKFVKSFSLSIVILLTILQGEAIWRVVYSNIMFINDLHRKREDRAEDADV